MYTGGHEGDEKPGIEGVNEGARGVLKEGCPKIGTRGTEGVQK